MKTQPDYDGPLINGRPILTLATVRAWCALSHLKFDPEISELGMIEIAKAINHAELMRACWDADHQPMRRLGPHWAPNAKKQRGRPGRLENNMAARLRRMALDAFPGARESALEGFIAQSMAWLGVRAVGASMARATRRRESYAKRELRPKKTKDFTAKSALTIPLQNEPRGTNVEITVAEDTLFGVDAIAEYIGMNRRQAQYRLETKRLPAFKVGAQWRMRKSTYLAHIAALEAEALQGLNMGSTPVDRQRRETTTVK